ncbi:MAG: TIGR00266 family protein [Firmicutes bacterium]|nr:TIGR00266 family protein [Bacillota bacterium]
MEYRVNGTTMQTVEIALNPGEAVYSQTHQMAWMSTNIEMNTNTGGGVFKAIKRAFTGSSFFITEYSPSSGRGLVAFASIFPGQILAKQLAAGESLICRKDSFLCAEHSVTLDLFFRKQIGAGLFGGEGFILQKVTGPGTVFLDMSGEIVEKDLQAGDVLMVHVGHVGIQDQTVGFDIQMVPGFQNILFGGQGFFLATLTGPGKVILQSMPIANLAGELARYLHPGESGGQGGNMAGGVHGAVVGGLLNNSGGGGSSIKW